MAGRCVDTVEADRSSLSAGDSADTVKAAALVAQLSDVEECAMHVRVWSVTSLGASQHSLTHRDLVGKFLPY